MDEYVYFYTYTSIYLSIYLSIYMLYIIYIYQDEKEISKHALQSSAYNLFIDGIVLIFHIYIYIYIYIYISIYFIYG